MVLINENVEYNIIIKNDEVLLEKDFFNKNFIDIIIEVEFVIFVRKIIYKII